MNYIIVTLWIKRNYKLNYDCCLCMQRKMENGYFKIIWKLAICTNHYAKQKQTKIALKVSLNDIVALFLLAILWYLLDFAYLWGLCIYLIW